MTPKIAIIGQGYVGLPLALEFAKHFPVYGFDINTNRVAELNNGEDHTLEANPDEIKELIKSIYSSGLIGKTKEYFIILNGKGRNGKSLLTLLMKYTLGFFFEQLKNEYLTGENKIGNGINVDIANLHLKPFIL